MQSSVQFRTENELETLFFDQDFIEDADRCTFQISTGSKMTGLCFACFDSKLFYGFAFLSIPQLLSVC